MIGGLLVIAVVALGAGNTWFGAAPQPATKRVVIAPYSSAHPYSEERMSTYQKPSEQELRQQLTPEQ